MSVKRRYYIFEKKKNSKTSLLYWSPSIHHFILNLLSWHEKWKSSYLYICHIFSNSHNVCSGVIKHLPVFAGQGNSVQIVLPTTFSCHFALPILVATVAFNSSSIVFSWMLLFYFSVLPVGFTVLGNLQLCVNSRLGAKSSSMYQLPDGSISRHTHTHTIKDHRKPFQTHTTE